MKKLIAMLLASVVVFTSAFALTGCGDFTEKTDDKKTQLFVANYNGGVGEKWLDNAKARFEAKHAETSFEEGKKGVQIMINHNKSHDGVNLLTTMKTSTYEVFFTGGANYYDFVGNELLYDVTDLVTKKVNDDDGKKIVDKLSDTYKSALPVNGKYYAIPHYDLYNGPSYDAGLFALEGLYFLDAEDTADTTYPGTSKMMESAMDSSGIRKSCGPDGIFNTYDDGLPSSMMEFYKLMDKMVQKGVVPFVWTGASAHYTNQIMRNVFANMGGIGLINANYEMDSKGAEIEYVDGFDGDKPIIKKAVITEDNAYLVRQSAAIYYALELAYKVKSNDKNYKSGCDENTYEHITAMEDIAFSGLFGSDKIAMIIDGNWWWNEANDADVFSTLEDESPEIYAQKDFRVMPMPVQYAGRVTEGNGKSPVVVNNGDSFCFVKSGIDPSHIKVMEEFISFVYSQNELLDFTKDTNGILKGVNYDYRTIKNSLNNFANSSLEIVEAAKESETYKNCISNHPIYIKNKATFNMGNNSWLARSSDDMFPFYAYDTASTLSDVRNHFNYFKIPETTWKNQYM